jgi:hypothetical protein
VHEERSPKSRSETLDVVRMSRMKDGQLLDEEVEAVPLQAQAEDSGIE